MQNYFTNIISNTKGFHPVLESFTIANDGGIESRYEMLALSQQGISGIESNACFRLQGVFQGRRELSILKDVVSRAILSVLY
jgi:hypothetical protein